MRPADKVALDPGDASDLREKVEVALAAAPARRAADSDLHVALRELAGLKSIVPEYRYWSPADPPAGNGVATSAFADGGSLDNTGVASMLSYTDIDNVVALLNVQTRLEKDDQNRIVVDQSIPPLFDFQPYDKKTGYVPFADTANPSHPTFQFSQIFPSADFDVLLKGLWAARADETGAVVSRSS